MNPIVLTISFDQTSGSVSVGGPIDNKMLCYSLLEMARDAVKDHADAQAKSPIVRPSPVVLPLRPA